jgi:spore germination protein GerM
VSSSRASAGQPQAYLLEIAGDRLQLVPNPVSFGVGESETAVVERALKEVLAAANDPNALSMIPAGTRLLDVKVAADGIHVNVSQEFRSGGGSASMVARVAQIIYTATSVDPKASVFLSIEGKPVDRNLPLGGEGLILRQPTTRAEFREDFSLS